MNDHATLVKDIADFYDASTPLWLDTWGEHMHHGYYGADGRERKDHRRAQVDLIDEVLRWGQVQEARRILDIGCGVGGSARYLARRFGGQALGVTLSPVQAQRAKAYNRAQGLEERVTIRVQDAYTLDPEETGSFDLIWSLESAEHMGDKAGLLDRCYELLAPGGQLLLITWCHRATPPALSESERKLLENLYDHYHLPPMISIETYEQLAHSSQFTEVATADWSQAVAPFWGAVIRSALNPANWSGLLQAGSKTLNGAWAMRYMQRGFRRGTIRFGLLRARRPA